MNTNNTALLDPFDLSAPDEAAELSAFVRALELAEGFRLMFVRCNQIPQRERLMEEVSSRLPNLKIQTIFFREPIQHLLDKIKSRLSTPLPDALFISGLEFSLPVVAQAQTAPLIANLNASRNSLAQLLPCPLILWVPEYVLTAIAQGAPDFFSIQSSVYFFTAKLAEMDRIASTLFAGESWQDENLTKDEKQERLMVVENLLSDYKLLPDYQHDYGAEMRLHHQLGNLHYLQGSYDLAIKNYKDSWNLAIELNDRKGMASSLQQLGTVYQERAEYDKAKKYYEGSLQIKEELGDHDGIANSLHNLGMVSEDLGEYEKAKKFYEEALQIRNQMGDTNGIANSLHQLGNLHYLLSEYEEAEKYYQQALQIKSELGDRNGMANSLHQLGMLFQERGEYEAAKKYYEQSLQTKRELGDRGSESRLLHTLGNLYFVRGEYAVASKYYEHALQLAIELDDRGGIARTLGQLGQLFTETGDFAKAFPLLLRALGTFVELQSPYARLAVNDLRNLRVKWEDFDSAWQQATGGDLPEWLLRDEGMQA